MLPVEPENLARLADAKWTTVRSVQLLEVRPIRVTDASRFRQNAEVSTWSSYSHAHYTAPVHYKCRNYNLVDVNTLLLFRECEPEVSPQRELDRMRAVNNAMYGAE